MTAQQRFDLTGKIALVTGAARGIGEGLAVGLAEHGADVVVLDQSEDVHAVVERIEKLGRRAWSCQQDLAQTQELAPQVDRLWEQLGHIDILVNNAGIATLERFNELTIERWRQTFAVNVDAMFFLTQRVAEHMIRHGIRGRVVNLSSTNGLVAEGGLAHYNSTKGAVEMLTQSLAIELGEHGITVNCLAPGIIHTQIADAFEYEDGDAFWDYFRKHIPLEHRGGTIEECIGAVVLFASSAGSYITGQHMVVDGGLLTEQVPRLAFMPPYRNSLTGQAKANKANDTAR